MNTGFKSMHAESNCSMFQQTLRDGKKSQMTGIKAIESSLLEKNSYESPQTEQVRDGSKFSQTVRDGKTRSNVYESSQTREEGYKSPHVWIDGCKSLPKGSDGNISPPTKNCYIYPQTASSKCKSQRQAIHNSNSTKIYSLSSKYKQKIYSKHRNYKNDSSIPGFCANAKIISTKDEFLAPLKKSRFKSIQYGDTSLISIRTDDPHWYPGHCLNISKYEGRFVVKKSIVDKKVRG